MKLSFNFGDFFWVPFAVSLILFVWFNTNAFIEYCRLLGFKKLFLIDKFENSPELDYPSFLINNKNCFLFRLLVCPACLGAWINAGFFFLNYDFILAIVNYWVSLFAYFILNKNSK